MGDRLWKLGAVLIMEFGEQLTVKGKQVHLPNRPGVLFRSRDGIEQLGKWGDERIV